MNGVSLTTGQFGQLLWTASWQAAVLAVIVAVVCRLLRRKIKPAWQFALWSLVFVRLACPVLPSSVFSVQNLFGPSESPPLETDNAPTIPERSSITRSTTQEKQVLFSEDEFVIDDSGPAAAVPDANPAVAEISAAASFEFSFWPAGMVFWGTIASLLLIRQFLIWRRLGRLSCEWREVTDAQTLQVLEDCCRAVKLRRRVRLLQADGQVGPAVLGVLRPRVVIPADVLSGISPEELRMLLLHELQHIRRWDVLWDRLATLLVSGHWFNPFAWWARKCLRDAREQACDAAVLRQIGAEQAKPYGHLVMTLAERQNHRPADAALVGMLGRSRSLSRRIERIAGYRPSSVRHAAVGLMLILMLIAGGLTSAQKQTPDKEVESAVEKPETIRDRTADQDYSLAGECTEGEKQPLADVRLRLFRVSEGDNSRELVKETKTKADGTFRFENLPAPQRVDLDYGVFNGLPFFEPFYVIAADKPGYASALIDHRFPEQVNDRISIKMLKAGKLVGRVTNPQGHPIAGADVFVQSFPSYDPIEDLMSTKTDADGRYVLDDLPLRASDEETTTDSEGESYGVVTEILFRVTHPDYGRVHPTYSIIPSQVDVTLEPAARVEGTVLDKVTGKPASGVKVELRGAHPTNDWNSTTTDEQARYSFSNLSKGQYNIWAEAPERTCYAIESLSVEAGKAYRHQNLELIEGSWIEGKVVDHVTGQPITEADGNRVQIRGYGPSHPKPGASYGAPVDQKGKFRVRVAPGTNSLHVSPYSIGKRVLDGDKYHEGFEVSKDEIVSIEFRVLPEVPEKYPKTSEIRFPIPVPTERGAAAAIRRLGGWYQVDESKHVVEVNMVYHQTADGVRYDNDQHETDEALNSVKQFPELKRLFLKEGQATDEGLKHIVGLKKLEVVHAWHASKLSDEGVQHLSGLTTLKNIHISNSKIGDGALKVFGQLPNVERLSLQGNRFTDAGVPHLKNLTSLESLWMGLGKSKFTDEACDSLGELTSLEELSLWRCAVTDAGIRKLSKLSGLKKLHLGGTEPDEPEGITDNSVEVLTQFTKLESLMISKCRFTDEGARKLADLPNLKQLSLGGSAVTLETYAELKKKYPDIWINITDE